MPPDSPGGHDENPRRAERHRRFGRLGAGAMADRLADIRPTALGPHSGPYERPAVGSAVRTINLAAGRLAGILKRGLSCTCGVRSCLLPDGRQKARPDPTPLLVIFVQGLSPIPMKSIASRPQRHFLKMVSVEMTRAGAGPVI